MTTFDSTKSSLSDLLREIRAGAIQLPDFQRGWVWDNDHVRDLLLSIARSFPIGAVTLLEGGGAVRFQTRPLEGLENFVPKDLEPERLILDGQQRLTTLTQAIGLPGPVRTKDARGKPIERHYYFDIRRAMDAPYALDEAIVAVDENRKLTRNFGRDVVLDLSSTELECKRMHFPCSQIMDSDDWEYTLLKVAEVQFQTYTRFRKRIVKPFRDYQLPIIQLRKETTREAVCLVFEKVNTGGVNLTVFELVTASYASEGYNLRDDWFGSERRGVESRRTRLEEDSLLNGIKAPDFLQGISLLFTHDVRQDDMSEGKSGKQVRPISAKRADILTLPLDSWRCWADKLETGFRAAARFLRQERFYDRREVPYTTQLVPLAAVLARLEDRWREPSINRKLARWFWSGVLGEVYRGAVETRIANDYEDLLKWFEDDDALPRTVRDANFQSDRFDTLRTRQSAAYKGIQVLVLRAGAKDWYWRGTIAELDADEVLLDIHHVFPVAWCKKAQIGPERYNSILNKVTISYKANRKMGGRAPSYYLPRIQKDVGLDDSAMDDLLESHALSARHIREDAFDRFLEDRRERLTKLVESAMGKSVGQAEMSVQAVTGSRRP